jgi:hypothetical protein
MNVEINYQEWSELRRDVKDALRDIGEINDTLKIQNGRLRTAEVDIAEIQGEMSSGEGRKRPITIWDVLVVISAITGTVGVLQFAHVLKWQ